MRFIVFMKLMLFACVRKIRSYLMTPLHQNTNEFYLFNCMHVSTLREQLKFTSHEIPITHTLCLFQMLNYFKTKTSSHVTFKSLLITPLTERKQKNKIKNKSQRKQHKQLKCKYLLALKTNFCLLFIHILWLCTILPYIV